MSEGWGDDDAWGSSGGGGAADAAPRSGGKILKSMPIRPASS